MVGNLYLENNLPITVGLLVCVLLGAMLLIHLLLPEGGETPVPAAQQSQRAQ